MPACVVIARHQTTVLLATLVTVMALIAGCGVDQHPEVRRVGGGSEGQIGDIAVRDAMFTYDGPITDGTAYPPGDTVSVQATVVNEGAVTDRLVSVNSPNASNNIILGTATIPGGHTLTAGYTKPGASVTMPDTTPIELRLSGLKTSIRAGLTYPVVFTFARAGQLRLTLQAEDSHEPRPDCPLPPDGKPTEIYTAPIGRAPTPPTTPAPSCSSLR